MTKLSLDHTKPYTIPHLRQVSEEVGKFAIASWLNKAYEEPSGFLHKWADKHPSYMVHISLKGQSRCRLYPGSSKVNGESKKMPTGPDGSPMFKPWEYFLYDHVEKIYEECDIKVEGAPAQPAVEEAMTETKKEEAVSAAVDTQTPEPPIKRKRGRPRKVRPEEEAKAAPPVVEAPKVVKESKKPVVVKTDEPARKSAPEAAPKAKTEAPPRSAEVIDLKAYIDLRFNKVEELVSKVGLDDSVVAAVENSVKEHSDRVISEVNAHTTKVGRQLRIGQLQIKDGMSYMALLETGDEQIVEALKQRMSRKLEDLEVPDDSPLK